MDSYITWPYQIADHYCRITWVYNKYTKPPECVDIIMRFSQLVPWKPESA